MPKYAKVIVKGSPITKSNFKLHNKNGRAILPDSSGKYHDRYALYEQEIALVARSQNPDIVFSESLIAVLKVYYKSEKRHPDTINITKSIFDGIEKSGLIINDAQITKIFTEEYYDKENPRFELELFAESKYNFSYNITSRSDDAPPKLYSPVRKNLFKSDTDTLELSQKCDVSEEEVTLSETSATSQKKVCSICKKEIVSNDFIKANGGKTFICKKCFSKLF